MNEFSDIMTYFEDWKVSATIKTLSQVPDANGQPVDTYTDGATIRGVLHTANINEKYFTKKWASDVTMIFKTDTIENIDDKSYLFINHVLYSVSGVNNHNELDQWDIGLKVHR